MNTLTLYTAWLKKRFSTLNTSSNRKWLLLYVIYTLFWWIGAHLVFLKRYGRAVLYLVAWIIITGSWIGDRYSTTTVLPSVFIAGLAFLIILFLSDFFLVFFTERKYMETVIPLLLIVLLFSLQVGFYEYLVNNNLSYIQQQGPVIESHFKKFPVYH